jgi:hypothetical protein
MSSPIHEPEDLDAALRYAPPWARRQASPLTGVPIAPRTENLPRAERSTAIRHPAGESAMAQLQRQLALNPDAIPEPPIDRSQSPWPLVLRTFAVLTLAALAAWALVALPSAHKPVAEQPPQQTQQTPAAAQSANRVKVERVASALNAPPMIADIKAVANAAPPMADLKTAATPPPAQAEAPPAAAAPPPPQPDPKPISSAPTLDADEIATLVKRGQDLLQNGDLPSARLLLQRAAEAGSASAAFTLGSTFDPLIIQRLGVIGIEADIARARTWYQKAAELGSTAATQQLAKLEQVH